MAMMPVIWPGRETGYALKAICVNTGPASRCPSDLLGSLHAADPFHRLVAPPLGGARFSTSEGDRPVPGGRLFRARWASGPDDREAPCTSNPAGPSTRIPHRWRCTWCAVAEQFDAAELADITRQVELRPGGVLSSGMEYPGRYSRWHLAYVDPPVEHHRARPHHHRAGAQPARRGAAAGDRGRARRADRRGNQRDERQAQVTVAESDGVFTEEQRSRQPTVFSALREIIAAFGLTADRATPSTWGCTARSATTWRSSSSRCASSYSRCPCRATWCCTFLTRSGPWTASGRQLPGSATTSRRRPAARPGCPQRGACGVGERPRPGGRLWRRRTRSRLPDLPPDPVPGSYARVVAQAREKFARGDLFEVVPGHAFYARCASPAAFFERLRRAEPGAVRVLPQPRRGRVPGRRVAGDVRAGHRRPGRDLPDLGHDRPRGRRRRRRGQDPDAADLAQGRVRADHVHRRGPQRQVAGLRAGQHHRSSAAARSRCTAG